MVGEKRSPARAGGDGYTLVALLVLVTVVNIAVAAALPTWTQIAKREKEAELVFRGMQYAEAIRVFQQRQGRYPTSLRELREIQPRSIRQLWTDPFNDDGEWGLIIAQTPQRGRRVDPNAQGAGDSTDERIPASRRRRETTPDGQEVIPRERVTEAEGLDIPRAGQVVARGPVIGVRSLSEDKSVREFFGATTYKEWLFTANLVPTLAQPAIGENIPRLHVEWVGRPFPPDLEVPRSGGMPSSPLERTRSSEEQRDLTRGRGSRRRGD